MKLKSLMRVVADLWWQQVEFHKAWMSIRTHPFAPRRHPFGPCWIFDICSTCDRPEAAAAHNRNRVCRIEGDLAKTKLLVELLATQVRLLTEKVEALELENPGVESDR